MSTLDRLSLDHDRLRTLLILFESELDAFEEGDAADLQLMYDITWHYSDYFNRVHHPLEDRMFECLLHHGSPPRHGAERMLMERAELIAGTGTLLTQLDEALQGAIVSRTALITSARQFLASNRAQMDHEEQTVFGWAEDRLSEENWREIEQRATSPATGKTGYTPLLQDCLCQYSQLQH